ncbi:MAG TPA: 3D domain-containing protein [Pyrinomonadaceae bacterium]|jgi:3D (Asp-Asp-Asp) domain-containing protein
MKMFFGEGAAFAATLLAASVLFYAAPLFAETSASQQPTSIQQEKRENNETASAERVPEADARQALEPAATNIVAAAGSAPAATNDKAVALSENVKTEASALVPAVAVAPPQAYVATAYSLPGRTASGMRVAKGVIAADPRVLPLGTRVRLEAGPYSGEYVVADTGSAVRGRKIDVWVPSNNEARRFGRRNIKLSVLSYGGRRANIRRQK